MWVDGKYSCGHEGRVQIYGSSSERQRKADYQFSGLCPDCYATKLAKKNEESAMKMKNLGFPKLSGTEKQVSWAESIRREFYERFLAMDYNVSYIIKANEKASFWIENRDRMRDRRYVFDYNKKHGIDPTPYIIKKK